MSIANLSQVLSSSLAAEQVWDWNDQISLAALKPPELLMGVRKDIVQGDISREWCKWIIEQFIDEKFLQEELTAPYVYSEVWQCLTALVGMGLSADDKKELAKILTNLVLQRVDFLKQDKFKRQFVSKQVKNDLLDIYGDSPRCWLTGYKFTAGAIFNFTAGKAEKTALVLPKYVDKHRPIGLSQRDISIEVDHLYPFSLGGIDDVSNYRLICGWANKVKSNYITGYSYGTKTKRDSHLYGKSYLYWALRLIGLKRKCEHDGCNNSVDNSELTVCSSLGAGKIINPISMKVICKEHDPLTNRYVKGATFDFAEIY